MTKAMHLGIMLLIIPFYCLNAWSKTIKLDAQKHSSEFIEQTLEAIQDGDTIRLSSGTFHLKKAIAIYKNNITIEGSGINKTQLDFTHSNNDAQAILVKRDGFTLKNLRIINPTGDGVVARDVSNLEIISIEVKWEKERFGGYGIYPVQCKNIKVDRVVVQGATDAGIYIGQSKNSIIENSLVNGNTVGIDIENSSGVTVRHNIAQNNAIGVVVSGRPFLTVLNPTGIQIHDNVIVSNNRANNASGESFVGWLGAGYGIKIVAAKTVAISRNTIKQHFRSDIYIGDYDVLADPYKNDSRFDPKTSGIRVSDITRPRLIITSTPGINTSIYSNTGSGRPFTVTADAFEYLDLAKMRAIICFENDFELADYFFSFNLLMPAGQLKC